MGKVTATFPVIVPPKDGIVTSKVVAVKLTVSATVKVSSFGTVPEFYVRKSKNTFWPISKLCPPDKVTVQVVPFAE